MGFYPHEVAEKSYNVFSEKEDEILIATVQLAPNQEYDRDFLYKFTGLGVIFDGTYRFRRITHTISPEGYTVEAEARMVYDSKGNFVEKGVKKAPLKQKADKSYVVRKGDTLWDIAKRFCKSPLDWKEIEKANHQLLIRRDKRNVKDLGHWIYPGQKIIIPGRLLK